MDQNPHGTGECRAEIVPACGSSSGVVLERAGPGSSLTDLEGAGSGAPTVELGSQGRRTRREMEQDVLTPLRLYSFQVFPLAPAVSTFPVDGCNLGSSSNLTGSPLQSGSTRCNDSEKAAGCPGRRQRPLDCIKWVWWPFTIGRPDLIGLSAPQPLRPLRYFTVSSPAEPFAKCGLLHMAFKIYQY